MSESHTDPQHIAAMKAADDFEGLGKTLKELFRLPQSLCKTRGNCCRIATYQGVLSPQQVQALATSDAPDASKARDFLTLFEPYATLEEVRVLAPVFVDRVLENCAPERRESAGFFKCKFLGAAGRCEIHEDRPTGCRVYPFPHESMIYHPGCGFEQRGTENLAKMNIITAFFEQRIEELETQRIQMADETAGLLDLFFPAEDDGEAEN